MPLRKLVSYLAEPIRCPLWSWWTLHVAAAILPVICLSYSPLTLGLVFIATIILGTLLFGYMWWRHPKPIVRQIKEQEAATADSSNWYEATRRIFLLALVPRWLFLLLAWLCTNLIIGLLVVLVLAIRA